MTDKKKIAIFGAGIGGLTVAHHLSSYPDYQIDIYEDKPEIGGMARSGRDSDGCATEYCWRVIFGFYDAFLKILGEIPVGDGRTVKDLLTTYKHINVMEPLSIRDRAVAYYNILAGLSSCDERLDYEDHLTWWEALGMASDSNMFRHVSGWLGMDRFKASYRSVIKVGIEMQMYASVMSSNYKDYVTTKPTSEAIFDPWKKLLESRGVVFHTSLPIRSIHVSENGEVVATNGEHHKVRADYYILALPINALGSVLAYEHSTLDLAAIGLSNIDELNSTSLHTQLSFQLYFDRPISLGGGNAFLVVESPWDLIVQSYDQTYSHSPTEVKLCNDLSRARGGWSVAACTATVPGSLYHKPMLECTEDEIKKELWYQLSSNRRLQDLIRTHNSFELTDDMVVKWADMWPTFYYHRGHLETTEPKFTNNIGSAKLRPSFQTYIPNLFISTAYVKETIDIFSMEAACIAGGLVANAIDVRVMKPSIRPRPLLFAPMRAVDKILWCMRLPTAFTLAVVIVIIISVWCVIRK